MLMPLLVSLSVTGGLAACDSDSENQDQVSISETAVETTGPTPGAGNPAPKPSQPPREPVPAPKEISQPREPTISGRVATEAVEKVLGREVEPGQRVVIGARCRAGTCAVRFRSVPRGGGVVLETQSDILQRLFARDDVRAVVLYVHHQSTGAPKKNEAGAFITTTCRRSAHPGFRWAKIGPGDIPMRCRFTQVAGGRQRSLVRRGELSNEEASRGKGG